MRPLALDRVRCVGEPVVAVAASRALAADAVEPLQVDCAPLPAVLDPAVAIAPGAPLIHPELGDNVLYATRVSAGDAPTAGSRSPRRRAPSTSAPASSAGRGALGPAADARARVAGPVRGARAAS